MKVMLLNHYNTTNLSTYFGCFQFLWTFDNLNTFCCQNTMATLLSFAHFSSSLEANRFVWNYISSI